MVGIKLKVVAAGLAALTAGAAMSACGGGTPAAKTPSAASVNQQAEHQASSKTATVAQVDQALIQRLNGQLNTQVVTAVDFYLPSDPTNSVSVSVIVGKATVAQYAAGEKSTGGFVEAPSQTVGAVVSATDTDQAAADSAVAKALHGF
jgi:hypothetical protein